MYCRQQRNNNEKTRGEKQMNKMNPWYSLTNAQGVELMDALQISNKLWNTSVIHNPKEVVLELGITDPTLVALVSSASRYKLNSSTHVPLRDIVTLIQKNIPNELKARWKGHIATH